MKANYLFEVVYNARAVCVFYIDGLSATDSTNVICHLAPTIRMSLFNSARSIVLANNIALTNSAK